MSILFIDDLRNDAPLRALCDKTFWVEHRIDNTIILKELE